MLLTTCARRAMIGGTTSAYPVPMAYIRVRRTCEVGESCPSLTVDTETGDALIGGPVDTDAAAELGFPAGRASSGSPPVMSPACSTVSSRTPSSR